MWLPRLKLCIEGVSDDSDCSSPYVIPARISSQPARNERANFRHVCLCIPVTGMLCGGPPEDHPGRALDRTPLPNARIGFSGTPREKARELHQDTDLPTGRHKVFLPLF